MSVKVVKQGTYPFDFSYPCHSLKMCASANNFQEIFQKDYLGTLVNSSFCL